MNLVFEFLLSEGVFDYSIVRKLPVTGQFKAFFEKVWSQ